MFRLKLIFCLAASSIVAIEPISGEHRPYRGNNRAPNILTKEFYEIKKDSTAWEHNQMRLQNSEIRKATPQEREELLKTKPGKDVRVIDLAQYQTEEIKKACTTPVRMPLFIPHYQLFRYEFVKFNYDINEHGYPVNVEFVSPSKSHGAAKNNAMNDMLRTKFKPPALGDQKLFCRNAWDQFHYDSKGLYINMRATRISNGTYFKDLTN